jgi:hypothetical protein
VLGPDTWEIGFKAGTKSMSALTANNARQSVALSYLDVEVAKAASVRRLTNVDHFQCRVVGSVIQHRAAILVA